MTGTAEAAWLGLDVGGTKILAVLIDGDGRELIHERCDTKRDEGPDAVIARAVDLCFRTIEGQGHIGGVGVGFAGLVDTRAGKVRSSIMLPGWDDFPLSDTLAERLELPCVLENDATTAGYGEYLARGAADGSTLILLTVGTGIGGAVLLDGKPFGGRSGLAGEFGNMSIDWRGADCWCGAKGCLNTLASGSAMSELAAKRFGVDEPVPLREIASRAREGDAVARDVLSEGARALATGIANIINIFNPDRVSLCGGVLQLGSDYLDAVRNETRARCFAEAFVDVTIGEAFHGYDSGAIGAALLARDLLAGTPGGAP